MAKSALLDEIKAVQSQHKPTTCTVALILQQVEESDLPALQQALDDPTIFGTSIAKVLKARGLDVGAQAIQRHRRKACHCE